MPIKSTENPSYPIVDETLQKDVPKNLKMIKTKIWEPYRLAEKFGKDNKKFKAGQFDVGENQSWKAKLSIFVRGNFFIPDARVFWVKPSVEFLDSVPGLYPAFNSAKMVVSYGSIPIWCTTARWTGFWS